MPVTDAPNMVKRDVWLPASLDDEVQEFISGQGLKLSEFLRTCITDGFAQQCEKACKRETYKKVRRRNLLVSSQVGMDALTDDKDT